MTRRLGSTTVLLHTVCLSAVQYSKSNRAKCAAGKTCDQKIEKDELRLGSVFGEPQVTKWRHW